MIVSKTPFRISFFGGGSDIPNFYNRSEGFVISTTIDKYIYLCIKRKFDNKIRLHYSKTEEVSSVSFINHPIIKNSLLYMDVLKGVEIGSFADIPGKGSGLGSSSSFAVGLLNALSAYKGFKKNKKWLAEKACHIEIDLCKEPIGKQDQFAASFGGFNLFRFYKNEKVGVKSLEVSSDFSNLINENLLIFNTSKYRKTSTLLKKQSENYEKEEYYVYQSKLVDIAKSMVTEIENSSLDNFGEALHQSWLLKKQLTKGVSNSEIDEIYKTGINNGASGGKILGAGGGGFMLFYAEKKYHKKIIKSLSNLKLFQIRFESNGTQIVYNDLVV